MLERLTEEEIAQFADFLVDDLRLWDCYEQTWVANAPIIARFENADVLVCAAKESEKQAFRLSDPEDENGVLREVAKHRAPAETCLCWRPYRSENLPMGDYTTLPHIYAALRAEKRSH